MKLTISIPKPCHEDWSAMTPQTDGRHCASCATTVADFSRLSDAQLIARFEQGDMPKCARFSKDQLDRVMSKPAEPGPNLLAAAATGAALMLVAPELAAQQGQTIMLGKPAIVQPQPVVAEMLGVVFVPQTPPVEIKVPLKDEEIETIEVGRPSDTHYYVDGVRVDGVPLNEEGISIRGGKAVVEVIEDEESDEPNAAEQVRVITGGLPGTHSDVPWTNADVSTITGRVIDENNESIPFASLIWTNGELAGATDFDGRFSIQRSPPNRDQNLRVVHLGFRPREVALPASSQACMGTTIVGDVVDAQGKPMPGVVVQIETFGISCTTDQQGRFAFDLPNEDLPEHILLQAKGLVGLGGNVSIASASLPQCVQLVMNGDAKHTQLQAKDIDLGDIVMDNAEIFMGEVVIMEPFASKAKRRIVRPFRWMGKQIAKPFR